MGSRSRTPPGVGWHRTVMTAKFYTRFVADVDLLGPSEYSGIMELGREDREPTEPRLAARLIARDLSVRPEEVKVLQWIRVH